MRLYYMTTADVAKIILNDSRLKLSLIDELNDPFELMAVGLDDKEIRWLVRSLREIYSKAQGVICMSDNWKSPVMWAHYAHKHYGVCLGFDVTEANSYGNLINEVRYSPDRLKVAIDKSQHLMGLTIEVLLAMYLTKAAEWSYEREFRLMANLKERETNGMYYVDFGPDLRLREVILGFRCKDSVGSTAKLVKAGRAPQSVRVLRARPAYKTFSMTENLEVKAITVPAAK